MNIASHLSLIEKGSSRISWHTSIDLQAVRLVNGEEIVLVEGRKVPSNRVFPSAIQVVLNLCQFPSDQALGMARKLVA